MAEAVYILCALTALTCAVLLLRAYGRTQSRLLLWSGLCFVGLTLSNIMLFIDLVVLVTQVDLYLPRVCTTLTSVSILLYGLIWDAS